jgi:hypothetical protein
MTLRITTTFSNKRLFQQHAIQLLRYGSSQLPIAYIAWYRIDDSGIVIFR